MITGFFSDQTPGRSTHRGERADVSHQHPQHPASSSGCLIITVFPVQTFWVSCHGSLSHPCREKTKSRVFLCLFSAAAYIFVLCEEYTPPGAPFSTVAEQPGLGHQAGFRYGKELADLMESCRLGQEQHGSVGVLKSQRC